MARTARAAAPPDIRGGSDAYRRFSLLTVAATILLIGAGSVVRTSGSGLGCPDWPLCHGQVLPPLDRTALIEWSHRTIAAATGAMVLVVAAWTWLRYRTNRLRAVASLAVVPLLIVQALLGREAVVRELPPAIVATHLLAAMLLLAAIIVMATPRTGLAPHTAVRDPIQHHVRFALVASVLTVGIGAIMVAHGAAYACSSWPGCAEAALPWHGTERHLLHWLHRAVTLLGFLAALNLAVRAHRASGASTTVRRTAPAVLALYVAQMLLGAANVLWQPGVARVGHLVLAAVILATLVTLAVRGCVHSAPGRTLGRHNDHLMSPDGRATPVP